VSIKDFEDEDFCLNGLLLENIKNEVLFNQLLLNGADINAQNTIGWCVLFEMISLGLNDKISKYINNSINIHVRDKKGRNALFWAIYFNNEEAVKILVSKGITSYISKDKDLDALHYCIYKDNKTLLDILLSFNINKNQESEALIFAVLYKNLGLIDYLLEKGANTIYKDSRGNSARSLANELKIEEIINKIEGYNYV